MVGWFWSYTWKIEFRTNLEVGTFLQIQLSLPERSWRTIRVMSSAARKNSDKKKQSLYHFHNISSPSLDNKKAEYGNVLKRILERTDCILPDPLAAQVLETAK